MSTPSNEFVGLPFWKRMYGHGDMGTLDATMLVAFLGNVDRRALAGMLPEHPTLRVVGGTPLVVIQSDFTRVVDNGDPDRNEYRYHEVMIAAVVGGVGGPLPSLMPLILFVDDPLIMASGREFYGFPKVMGEVIYEPRRAVVRHTFFPGGVRTTHDVMRASWSDKAPFVARVLTSAAEAAGVLARAAGVDEDTFDFVTNLASSPFGRVLNLRQLADLTRPRRATRSELTLFQPKVVDPKLVGAVADYRLELPDEPVWELRRRLFDHQSPKTVFAFEWQARLLVTTGQVVDVW
jgi:hypothetical protein